MSIESYRTLWYMFDYIIHVCVYEIQRTFRTPLLLYVDTFRNPRLFRLEYPDRQETWQADIQCVRLWTYFGSFGWI